MSRHIRAAESIAVQNDTKFTDALDDIWGEIIDFAEEDNDDEPALAKYSHLSEKMQALLTNRFGIAFTVKLGSFPQYIAACQTPRVGSTNALRNSPEMYGMMIRGKSYKDLYAPNSKTGTVDLKHARVTGIFSTIPTTVYLDPHYLCNVFELSARQCAAVTLHEIGHAFTFIEYSYTVERTNRLLADAMEELKKDPSVKNIKYVLKGLEQKGVVNPNDVVDLYESNNRVVIGLQAGKAILKKNAEQLPGARYTDTASEQLADQFAARFGYYRDLVSSLHIFHHGDSDVSANSVYWATSILSVVGIGWLSFVITYFVIGLPLAVLGATPGILGLVTIVGINVIAALLAYNGAGDDNRDMTYDDLWFRLNRIRGEAVSLLKTADHKNVSYLSDILSDIAAIEKLRDQNPKTTNLVTDIVNFIKPSARRAASGIEYEKGIETLLNNDIYVQLAHLSVGAQHE